MKKMLYALSAVLLIVYITGCKKNKTDDLPKETVLSQVIDNGKLQLEYEYNKKQQLSKVTEYNLTTGKAKNSQSFTYDDKGRLDIVFNYNANGKLDSKEKYFKDKDGNFEKKDYTSLSGIDSGKVVNRIQYTYDNEGHIAKEAWIDLVSGQEQSYRQYTWYANGNMKSSDYYGQVNPAKLWWSTEYSPAGNTLPETLAKHAGYPVNSYNGYFVAEKIHYKIIAGYVPPQEYEESMSARKYDTDGLLIEQKITVNNIFPAALSAAHTMKYVYKQI